MIDWLDKIEARMKAATPGPWFIESGGVKSNKPTKKDEYAWVYLSNVDKSLGARPENASFIAHSREDIDKLTKALRISMGALQKVSRGETCMSVTAETGFITVSASNVFAIEALAAIEKMGDEK